MRDDRLEERAPENASATRRWARHAAPLLALSAVLACGPSPPPAPGRPNVLLVSVDCLRADHLSCYGYSRETSPTLDRLAGEGVRFERVHATTSWTLPSHLSMLTGLPVSAHGVDDDRLWQRTAQDGAALPAPLRAVFLPELLAQAGYATAGFYTWKYLEPRFGFGPGFDLYERLGHTFYSHPLVGPEFERLRQAGDAEGMQALMAAHPALFDDTHPSTPEAIDRARAWLDEHARERAGRPFFLFVHLFDVHDPYTPPEPWFSMFDPDYEGPIDGRRITSPDSPVHARMRPRDLERVISLYDGAIRFVDAELARLFARLDELGVAQDTLVIVTGDHGEEFFEHGMKTHRNQLYQESVRVPLLLRWPRGLPGGRVVPGNAGLVDIAPTVLAAASLAPATPLGGVDLLPIARGTAGNGERTYVSELVLFAPGESVPTRQLAIARGSRQTLFTTKGAAPWSARAYDLERDPAQQAGEPVDEARIAEDLAALRAELAALRAAQPARAADARPLDPRELAELAALGYGGDGAQSSDPRDGVPERGTDAPERLSLDGGVWPDE